MVVGIAANHNFKLIFGVLGNIIGVGVNLAPTGTFSNIYKKKSTQGFSGLPYVFALSAALLWILYGLPSITPHATLLLTINSAASLIQICYLTIYITYGAKNRRRHVIKVMAVCFAALAIVTIVTLFILKTREVRTKTVGCLCVVIGIMSYASPLSVARMVYITKSVEFLPIVLCCFLFINSVIWSCYGIFTEDIFVMIPNGFGAFFGVAQLSLYLMYRNTPPLDPFDPLNYKKKKPSAEEKSVRPSKQHGLEGKLDTANGDVKHGENGQVGNGDAKTNGSVPNGNAKSHHDHHVDIPGKDQPANGDAKHPPGDALQSAGLRGQASKALTFDSPNRIIPQSPKSVAFTMHIFLGDTQ